MLDKGKICQKIAKCFVLLTKQGLILTACLFWYLVFFLLNCCSQLCSGLYMWYVLNLSVDLFCKCLCYWRVFFTFCCALPPWASAGSVQYIQRFFLSICTLCIYTVWVFVLCVYILFEYLYFVYIYCLSICTLCIYTVCALYTFCTLIFSPPRNHVFCAPLTQFSELFSPSSAMFCLRWSGQWFWRRRCLKKVDDDDELMLNVLRCHLTY